MTYRKIKSHYLDDNYIELIRYYKGKSTLYLKTDSSENKEFIQYFKTSIISFDSYNQAKTAYYNYINYYNLKNTLKHNKTIYLFKNKYIVTKFNDNYWSVRIDDIKTKKEELLHNLLMDYKFESFNDIKATIEKLENKNKLQLNLIYYKNLCKYVKKSRKDYLQKDAYSTLYELVKNN